MSISTSIKRVVRYAKRARRGKPKSTTAKTWGADKGGIFGQIYKRKRNL